MSRLALLIALLGILVLGSGAQAGIADSTTFQGQLTDVTNHPVDGSFDVTYSLWTDSSAGTMLWSQVLSTTFKSGLFTICLGCSNSTFFDAMGGSADVWLQTQISGQPAMTPRTKIRNAPRAMVAVRMNGDIGTGPGLMVVGDTMSGSYSQTKVQAGLQQAGSALASGAAKLAGDCSSAGASFRAINTKGNGSVLRTRVEATDSANVTVLADDNGDGIAERTVHEDCDDHIAAIAIDEPGVHIAQRMTPDSIVFDEGGDPGSRVMVHKIHRGGNLMMVRLITADSTVSTDSANFGAKNIIHRDLATRNVLLDENRFINNSDTSVGSTTCDSSGVTFRAINTKGTGAVCRTTSQANDSASLIVESDNSGGGGGGAGGFRSKGIICSKPGGSSGSSATFRAINTKGNGSVLRSWTAGADSATASVVLAADLDGDGLVDRSVSSTVDTGQAGIAIDEPGVQVNMGFRKGWDGTIKGRFTIDSALARRVEMNSAGDGYLDGHLGIGVDPTHRIDVAGGAYCDGTNWTNASDANLKENFREVDGQDVLQKLDNLTISEWNYKSDSTGMNHIGPTAQDFRAVFGVGSDGKSISTIDPSGIALAAIRELHKKVKEVDELKVEVQELKALVEKLAADKGANSSAK